MKQQGKIVVDTDTTVISTKGNISAVFNEWARRFAENPGAFGPVVGDDGKLISDYGERCEAYFLRVYQELGNGATAMNADTVVISRAEYAELLRCKAAFFESKPALAGEAAAPIKIEGQKGKVMSQAERAEVMRLHGLGYRPIEIAKFVSRSISTISAWIRKNEGR